MAEPAGLLLECAISEQALARWFKSEVPHGTGTARIGHVLSALLDRGDEDGDIVIVHHDADRGQLFLAWILNHYQQDLLAPVWPIVQKLAHTLDGNERGTGLVASLLPVAYEAIEISDGTVTRSKAADTDAVLLRRLSDRLWSFAVKDEFANAAASMRRATQQCKPFKAAWKSYLAWRDEQERPARIAAATITEPFRLAYAMGADGVYADVYTADGKVFERHDFTRRDIPFPDADALTFRAECGYFADRHHVWQRQLAYGSPPGLISEGSGHIGNRKAIWEYIKIDGADGASFRGLFHRFDTIYWKDKNRVYSRYFSSPLTPLTGADPVAFRLYGQCFGTDGKKVFYGSRELALDPKTLQTKDYFIWDDEKVFYEGTELPIRAAGFRIIGSRRIHSLVQLRVTDGDTTVLVGPGSKVLPDDPAFESI